MVSTTFQIFQQALEQAELVEQLEQLEEQERLENPQPGVEMICSDEREPVDEPVVNASFVYSILNGDTDSPHLTTEVDDYSTANLDCLAKLLAPMSHPQFFYLVLSKIQQDFTAANRELDFNYLMQEVEKQKAEFESQMGEPYITPLDLSRRGEHD